MLYSNDYFDNLNIYLYVLVLLLTTVPVVLVTLLWYPDFHWLM